MKNKRIVTMTMIKNEADIIEIFVRYTMSFAKKMIFIDNGCTDNTIEILKKLKAEGYKIEIYNESNVLHEQYIIENRYLYKIIEEVDCDFILPLDADEFLTSNKSLFKSIEKLDTSNVLLLKWRTYVLTDKRKNEKLFLNEISKYRINEDLTFTKVLIPIKLIKDFEIYIKNGHHSIESNKDAKQIEIETLFIAHYPVRSEEQIKSKIYQGAISQLSSSYSKVVAFHWSDIYNDLKNGNFDLIKYSLGYALPKNVEVDVEKDIIEGSINLKEIEDIKVKYDNLAIRDPLTNIASMMEVMSIKNVIEKMSENNKKNILIFGTGKISKEIFYFINKRDFNILAYIDSDRNKELSYFEDRIIISPSKIKFLSYDIIVVASNRYEEILDILLNEGVCINKIKKKSYFLEEKMRIEK